MALLSDYVLDSMITSLCLRFIVLQLPANVNRTLVDIGLIAQKVRVTAIGEIFSVTPLADCCAQRTAGHAERCLGHRAAQRAQHHVRRRTHPHGDPAELLPGGVCAHDVMIVWLFVA